MPSPPAQPRKVLVFLPSWVGDAVMATPALRALRQLYADAEITWLVKAYVRDVIDAAPWCDRLITVRPPGILRGSSAQRRGSLALTVRLRQHHFDLAVLLPNSFRAATMASLANIPRRIGYDRDGRGFLLTDRLLPLKQGGRYVPLPIINYYLALVSYLGAASPSRRIELFTRPADDAATDQLLREAGIAEDMRPLVMLNPGAATKGDAKLWPAERFAAVADALIERCGAAVLINGSPKERPILDEVRAAAKHGEQIVDLPSRGGNLRLSKSIARRCHLAIGNDSGGRHIAAAMGVPLVSLFGPTDPEWTRLDLPHERVIHAASGRMRDISMEQVLEAAMQLLGERSRESEPA